MVHIYNINLQFLHSTLTYNFNYVDSVRIHQKDSSTANLSADINETDPYGIQCLSIYIPLTKLGLVYWPESHSRTRNLQNSYKCGVQMQTFQFEEKVKAEFANLDPFQILVVCSDALVHFSSQNNRSSWIQFRITQSSTVSSRQLLEQQTLFSNLMIKGFDNYNDPMEVVKRSGKTLSNHSKDAETFFENNVGESTKQVTAPEPAKSEESIVSTAADKESNSLQADTQPQLVKKNFLLRQRTGASYREYFTPIPGKRSHCRSQLP